MKLYKAILNWMGKVEVHEVEAEETKGLFRSIGGVYSPVFGGRSQIRKADAEATGVCTSRKEALQELLGHWNKELAEVQTKVATINKALKAEE